MTARVYVVRGRKDLVARQAILTEVVRDAVADGSERLVLERDDSVLVHDARVLRSERARLGAADSLRYEMLPAVTEPLLWVPDALAWAWSRDETWRRRVAPLFSSVTDL